MADENRDIFNRNVELGAPMSADAVRVLFSEFNEEDLMMQSIAFQYQQAITRLWELGSPKTYMYAGRTEGNINAKRVIGRTNASLGFIQRYGDVCNMSKNHLTLMMTPGCGVEEFEKSTIKASGCVINAVTYTVQAMDKIIHEDLNLMFVKLNQA